MTTYYFVDGLCGAGKTHAAVGRAIPRVRNGQKYLFVQPTQHLIDQTVADCKTLDPNIRVRAIHGETNKGVLAKIVEHTKETSPGGEILFITHSALMMLPYFDRPHQWHVICDEIPQADFSVELDVPHSHSTITDLIEIDDEARSLADNQYARIRPKNRARLEKIAQNRQSDQVWKIFQPFATKLISAYWENYVLDSQYMNLIGDEGDVRRLLAFGILKPSLFEGFALVTLMGACFRSSMLYHLWTRQGVTFKPHRAIQKGLRYQRHENGKPLTIRYATDESWSKSLRGKLMEDGGDSVFEHIVDRVRENLSGTDFVWMANKDVSDDIFDGIGQRLSNSPHGLNQYQHLHDVVVLSALNPRPAHYAFLEAVGLDGHEVREAGYWQSVYQAAMRISLRNPDDQTPKTVTVMDRPTALWLQQMFPGSKIETLGLTGVPEKGKAGRPRRHADDAERKRAHREKFRTELCAALDLVNGTPVRRGGEPQLANRLRQTMSEFGFGRDEALSTMGRHDLGAMAGTVYASLFDAMPFDFMPMEDIDTFIRGLRFFHKRVVPSKDVNAAISPAIFDPDLSPDTSRGIANVRAIWGIWLDCDGGDLTPEEFARLFPKLRVVVCNTYSTTPDNPRWRAFIPTTIAMPIAAYQAIIGQIMRTLNRAGYWSDDEIKKNQRLKAPLRHGLDVSKFNPASLFLLPCQAANPDYSFFKDFAGGRRQPLDPYEWAGYAANHARPDPVPQVEIATAAPSMPRPAPETIGPAMRRLSEALQGQDHARRQVRQDARRHAAIERWRQDGRTPGVGNRAFFDLGRTLANTGMTDAEITGTLNSEARFANRPADRRRQIRPMMTAIRRRVRR